MSLLELKNIVKKYYIGTSNEITVLNNLSLTIDRGELVAIVGQSGSGKSTLMNIIGALDTPTSGEYLLDGVPIQDMSQNQLAEVRNRQIGFIFQTFNLLGRSNALKNVELPMLYSGIPKRERRRRALELLEKVEMSDRVHHQPNELSGGQKQRVAIARAMACEPTIILADEPTGALDSKTSMLVMDLFLRLHRESGSTVLLITHSKELAERCERIVSIMDGEIISDIKNPAFEKEAK